VARERRRDARRAGGRMGAASLAIDRLKNTKRRQRMGRAAETEVVLLSYYFHIPITLRIANARIIGKNATEFLDCNESVLRVRSYGDADTRESRIEYILSVPAIRLAVINQ